MMLHGTQNDGIWWVDRYCNYPASGGGSTMDTSDHYGFTSDTGIRVYIMPAYKVKYTSSLVTMVTVSIVTVSIATLIIVSDW